jgi:predicted PurR-regulated permease PerM
MADSQQPPPVGDDVHRLYSRTFGLVAVAVFAVLLYWIVEPMLSALAWAVFLGFLLNPLQVRLTRLFGGRESAAAGVLTVAALLLVVVPIALLAAAFAAQAVDLAARMQQSAGNLPIHDMSDLARWPLVGPVLEWLSANVAGSLAEIKSWATQAAHSLLQAVTARAGALVLGAAGVVLSFTVMLFALFFCVRDGAGMARAAMQFVPLAEVHKAALAERLSSVTRAVVFGTALTAVAQGLLLGIGFAIAGIPAPVVFGVTGAVLSVVPFGGTAFVWVPGVIWLFVQGDIGHCVFLAAWGLLVVSTADNFLKPMLISGQAEVPTLAVFVGVLGGIAAFGLIGMFIGPIVIAVALTLLGFAHETLTPPAP